MAPQASYDIGFSTAFDETSYFAGYEIAMTIEKHAGDTAIARLLLTDPIRFSADYISLCKKIPVITALSVSEVLLRLL